MKLRPTILAAAGLAAGLLVPAIAAAQPGATCEQQRQNQAGATVAGAVVGGVIGNRVAGRGDRAAGTVVGAVIGGAIANQATRPDRDCRHAWGWYDRDGRWHANRVNRDEAFGYYDRDGSWIDGKPNGYYSGERWMASRDEGYWDDRGRWVPAGITDGYYDEEGVWVRVSARGGRGDRYDDRGMSRGDDRGRDRGGYVLDTRAREEQLERRIQRGRDDGSLRRWEARDAMTELQDIRRRDERMRDSRGRLDPRDEADIQRRLDALSDRLRFERSR